MPPNVRVRRVVPSTDCADSDHTRPSGRPYPEGVRPGGRRAGGAPTLPSSLRDYSAVHGSAPAAVLTGGVRLAPTVGLELEVGIERPTATPLRLESPTFRTFDGEVRDAVLGANLRWHLGRKYHIEMVVGGGLAHSRYARRSEVVSDPFGGRPTISVPDTEVNATQPSVGGGISIPISVGATVAVVPTVSYRWVRRPFYSDAARLSVGRHVFRVGVAVRRHARRASVTR